MKKWIFFLAPVIFISCKKENANSKPQDRVTSDTLISNIRYGDDPYQKFDLYLPAGRTDTTPVVILIHGGGWNAGDKGELSMFGVAFQKRKFAVANMNYRLAKSGVNNYPLQLDDIDSAIRLLIEKADVYLISKKRFYTIGHSAGAHLSLAYAYTRNQTGLVRAASGMATPTDLFSMAYYNSVLFGSTLTTLLGAPLSGATTDLYKNASPYYQVNSSSVPTILFQGDWDPVINISQANTMESKLNDLHVPNKKVIYQFAGHDWWSNSEFLKDTYDQAANWFNIYR